MNVLESNTHCFKTYGLSNLQVIPDISIICHSIRKKQSDHMVQALYGAKIHLHNYYGSHAFVSNRKILIY